jgi:two-component system, OmpR family, response regulator
MSSLKNILYVDDEPDIRTVVQLALERSGDFSVVTAASADEALGRLESWRPDLIVLDVMMPGTDGPGLLAQLKKDDRFRHIPVVFMTAKAQPRELESFKALGALGVIAKPFDPFTLAAELHALWTRGRKSSVRPLG